MTRSVYRWIRAKQENSYARWKKRFLRQVAQVFDPQEGEEDKRQEEVAVFVHLAHQKSTPRRGGDFFREEKK